MCRGVLRWGILTCVWSIAVLGVTLKSIFFRSTPEWLGLTMYLGMGWTCMSCLPDLLEVLPMNAVGLLVAGGVAYTGGV